MTTNHHHHQTDDPDHHPVEGMTPIPFSLRFTYRQLQKKYDQHAVEMGVALPGPRNRQAMLLFRAWIVAHVFAEDTVAVHDYWPQGKCHPTCGGGGPHHDKGGRLPCVTFYSPSTGFWALFKPCGQFITVFEPTEIQAACVYNCKPAVLDLTDHQNSP